MAGNRRIDSPPARQRNLNYRSLLADLQHGDGQDNDVVMTEAKEATPPAPVLMTPALQRTNRGTWVAVGANPILPRISGAPGPRINPDQPHQHQFQPRRLNF